MDIKTFVAESLQQIIEGVEQTQKQFSGGINSTHGRTNLEAISQVEFDIAVTIEQGSTTKGGIAIFGGAFGLGSQGASSKNDSSVSRIKFSVPVSFTQDQNRPRRIQFQPELNK
jgi:hypothetical protein